MKTYNSFPDLARTFKIIDLDVRLHDVMPDTIIGLSIHVALENKKPTLKIAKDILDSYHHNPEMISDVVGDETIQIIKSLLEK